MALVDYIGDFENELNRLEFYWGAESDEDDKLVHKINMSRFFSQRVDIFELFDDGKIYETFRFEKATIRYIATLIDNKIGRRTARKNSFSTVEQVLVALQFYATGTFQTVVGNVLHVSQPSASRIIHDVSLALCEISGDFIHYPRSAQDVIDVGIHNKVIWDWK